MPDLKEKLLAEKAKIEAALKFHEAQVIAASGALQVIGAVLAEPPASTPLNIMDDQHPAATPNGA